MKRRKRKKATKELPKECLIQNVMGSNSVGDMAKALSENDRKLLPYLWKAWARPEQIPMTMSEEEWVIWLYLAGRGAGKTRSGAEWIREWTEDETQFELRGAFVAATASDVRDIMVEGESGILSVSPPWNYPNYEPSKRRITWPEMMVSVPGQVARSYGGAVVICYSSEKPDRLRGPQHNFGWADELAAWQRMQETWDNFMMGLRLGLNPRACVTTTPRPLKLIKEMVKDPTVCVTLGTSYDNRMNLAPAFYHMIIKRYEGTRLGRQELNAEILDDNPSALFTRENLDRDRVAKAPEDLARVVIGVDPAVTSGEGSADTGIIPAGVQYHGDTEHYYILGDRTCHKRPDGWARDSVIAYDFFMADKIVGEVNNGGDLVESVIRNVKWADSTHTSGSDITYKSVRASRGKVIRAQPVSALSEQGRLHIVGELPELEDCMCQWSDDLNEASPDRLDAMVWGVTELMGEDAPRIRFL